LAFGCNFQVEGEPKERGGGGRGVGASYNLNIKTLWRIGDREAGHERKVVSEKGKNICTINTMHCTLYKCTNMGHYYIFMDLHKTPNEKLKLCIAHRMLQ
jgi:hypothetical protein